MQSNILSQWCGSVSIPDLINDSRTFERSSSSQDCLMTLRQAIGSIFIN